MERYIGIDEAAKLCGLSRYILREDMKKGRLTGYKCRNRVMTTERALEAYMQSCAIEPVISPKVKSSGNPLRYVPGMRLELDGSFSYPDKKGKRRA